MRLQLKILFGIKALPILKKNWNNLLGEGGGRGGFNKPMTDQALLNSLVSAAKNCDFMIHTLSGTTSISGSVQYPLRMNLILSNF